jgi:hypothetical protein
MNHQTLATHEINKEQKSSDGVNYFPIPMTVRNPDDDDDEGCLTSMRYGFVECNCAGVQA